MNEILIWEGDCGEFSDKTSIAYEGYTYLLRYNVDFERWQTFVSNGMPESLPSIEIAISPKIEEAELYASLHWKSIIPLFYQYELDWELNSDSNSLESNSTPRYTIIQGPTYCNLHTSKEELTYYNLTLIQAKSTAQVLWVWELRRQRGLLDQ